MKMKAVRIQLNGGLEARPVAMLVQVASQHDSTVYLESEGKKVNAKSIMGMMRHCKICLQRQKQLNEEKALK